MQALIGRPLRVLIPGTLVLVVLLAVVVRGDLAAPMRRDLRQPLDVTGLEAMFRPAVGEDELIARARAFAHDRGADVTGMFVAVWPEIDRDEIERLRAGHDAGAVVAFADLGAPLAVWTVSFYRPLERVAAGESTVVTLDRTGRVIGFARSSAEAPPVRRSFDAAEAARDVASWMRLAPERLEPRGKAGYVGTQLAHADAIWELAGARLGTARVVITATQDLDRAGGGTGGFTFASEVFDPLAMPSMAGAAGRTTAYWLAVMLAFGLAFVLGACAFGGESWRDVRGERIALAAGFGLAAGLAAVEGVVLVVARDGILRGTGVGFLAGAALAVIAAVWPRRREGSPPSRRVAGALIATVALSFVVASIACTGFLETGCTHACTLVRYTVAPLVVLALIAARRDGRLYGVAVGLAACALIPNCACGNVVNIAWIGWLGLSPMCYFAPFCVTLVAVIGLRGGWPRLCLAATAVASLGVGLIGLSHQLLGFPW